LGSEQAEGGWNLRGAAEGRGGIAWAQILLAQPKVGQHHVASEVEQDVFRFEIPWVSGRRETWSYR
jgi:hypothetical protein